MDTADLQMESSIPESAQYRHMLCSHKLLRDMAEIRDNQMGHYTLDTKLLHKPRLYQRSLAMGLHNSM
jgi:hypothetical protein